MLIANTGDATVVPLYLVYGWKMDDLPLSKGIYKTCVPPNALI